MAINVPSIKYERYPFEKLEAILIEKIEKINNAKSADEIIEIRSDILEDVKDFVTAASVAFMRFTLNTRDEFYLEEKNYYDEMAPLLQKYIIIMQKSLIESKFSDEIFKKLPEPLYKTYKVSLASFDEKIIEDLQKEANMVTEYTKLMSEMLFEFRGEKLPLPMLKKYMQDKDRATRAEAYNVLGATLESHSAELDDIYDRLVKIRTDMAKKMGYKNYVPLAYNMMGRICYDEKAVTKMRNNILNDVVPVVTRLRTERAKQMGIDEMKFYDYECVFAKGDPEPVLSAEGIFEAGKQMYHEMSPETAEFIDMMLENEAFDYISREGKWGGGYCTSFPKYKQPFILANFNGKSGDVDVLTHEAGHAFADYMLGDNDFELNVGGMETAETHSMSMEFFCWKWIDKFFGERANDYRYKHLIDSFTFLTYGIIVDYFQHIVYENPEMTPAERNEAWASLERQFMPYMNTKGITYLEKGTRWQYQMHIYENPFYYIDYVIAQSSALQFLIESQKNYDDAFKRYFKLLSQGGRRFYTTMLKEAELKSPFEDGALKTVAIETEKLVKELEKLISV